MKLIMKSRIYQSILALTLCFAFAGCDDKIDPVVQELDLDRAFSPVGLEARIRNQTTVELNWDTRPDVKHYLVEISADDMQFTNIVRTLEVTPDDLPVQETLDGETLYSIRVKAVSASGLPDSKWVSLTITTDPEQIFLSSEDGDIKATEATLRWAAGSEVTHLLIMPDTERDLTDDEKAAGVAVVTGLTGETTYTIILKNGEKTRGTKVFTTLIDLGDAEPIYPEDDIVAILDAADEGDSFVLFPGEYQLGSYAVKRSVTLSGYDPVDKPVIFGQFTCGATIATVELNYLDVRSDGTVSQFFNTQAGCNLTSLVINECEISGYANNFIYNNVGETSYGTIHVKNSYIHDIEGAGGDGIDFRTGAINTLRIENTTFANGFRTFLRMQVECNTIFQNCTFYKVATVNNSNNNGLFRTSGAGSFEVRNSLFVETGPADAPASGQVGNFCRQASYMVPTPVYSNNNIFNCNNLLVGLYTTAAEVSATEIDPGFADAANGVFTVTNQTIIDNSIGDPRWLP